MNPQISVIIPIYNSASFLRETVDSVLQQTFQNFELLLCDDGSTDGSSEIAREYEQKNPGKVQYLHHPGHANRGQFSTRILGAQNAKAEVLALLDSDDIWNKDYLENHYSVWNEQAAENIAFSYGPSLYWHFEKTDGTDDYVQVLPTKVPAVYPPGQLLDQFLTSGYGVTPCPSCMLIRRDIFSELEQFEPAAKETFAFEDQILGWYVSSKWPVYVHDNVWVKYRQHKKSTVATVGQGVKARQAELNFLRPIFRHLSSYCPEHPLLLSGKLQLRIDQLSRGPELAERLREKMKQDLPDPLRKVLGKAYRLYKKIQDLAPKIPIIRQLSCYRFRRLRPLNNGIENGTPIVRYYWDQYLQKHKNDIRGHALEIGTTSTIRRYGGGAVTNADAIDVAAHSPEVTVVADLSRADHLASDTYDCFLNQFSICFIYDVEAALYHSIRLLKPGGVLLINFPCLEYYFPTGLDMYTGAPIYMYWWFTPLMVENLLRRIGLGDNDYALDIYGNLFTRVAYQMNMPAEELTRTELGHKDGGHPLLICARVIKPEGWQVRKPEYREPWLPDAKAAQWNARTGHYPPS